MKMVLVIAGLLGSALIAQFLYHGRSSSISLPSSTPPAKVSQAELIDIDVQSSLVSSSWRFMSGEGPLIEGYQYTFSNDGTFVRSVISDYAQSWKGQWNYKQTSPTSGELFLLGEDRATEVLSYRFLDSSHLQLAGEILVPAGNGQTKADGARLPDIITEANFPSYFDLVKNKWREQKQIDSAFIPDAYSFRSDGTFVAEYRNQQCSHSGHWSLKAKNLLLEMPADHCDLRGNQTVFIWSQDFSLIKGGLRLNDKYQYEAERPQ